MRRVLAGLAIVAMVVGGVAADDLPEFALPPDTMQIAMTMDAAKYIQEVIKAAPEVDHTPLLQVMAGQGEASVKADVTAIAEAAKGEEWTLGGHLRRTWLRYLVGGSVAYLGYETGDHRGWWGEGSSGGGGSNHTTIEYNGDTYNIDVDTGDDSPVDIDIGGSAE